MFRSIFERAGPGSARARSCAWPRRPVDLLALVAAGILYRQHEVPPGLGAALTCASRRRATWPESPSRPCRAEGSSAPVAGRPERAAPELAPARTDTARSRRRRLGVGVAGSRGRSHLRLLCSGRTRTSYIPPVSPTVGKESCPRQVCSGRVRMRVHRSTVRPAGGSRRGGAAGVRRGRLLGRLRRRVDDGTRSIGLKTSVPRRPRRLRREHQRPRAPLCLLRPSAARRRPASLQTALGPLSARSSTAPPRPRCCSVTRWPEAGDDETFAAQRESWRPDPTRQPTARQQAGRVLDAFCATRLARPSWAPTPPTRQAGRSRSDHAAEAAEPHDTHR